MRIRWRGLELPHCVTPDEFCADLKELGIATGRHYPTPVHLQPAYRDLGYEMGDFPVAERVASTCVSLPMAAELTDEQVDYVVDCVRDVVRSRT